MDYKSGGLCDQPYSFRVTSLVHNMVQIQSHNSDDELNIYIYICDYYLTRPKILQNLEIKDSVGLGTSPGGEAQAPLAGSLAHAVHSPMALNASCTLGNALPGSAASQIDTGQIEMDASLGHCHCHCWPNQVKSALYIYTYTRPQIISLYIYIFNIYIYNIILYYKHISAYGVVHILYHI